MTSNVTVTVGPSSITVTYGAGGANTITIATAAAGREFQYRRRSAIADHCTIDYSGYGAAVSVDLTHCNHPSTFFGSAILNVQAAIGASVGGNTFTVGGNQSVTLYSNDTVTGSGGGNQYIGSAGLHRHHRQRDGECRPGHAVAPVAGSVVSNTITIGSGGSALVETLTNVNAVNITDTSTANGKTLDGSLFAGALSLTAVHGTGNTFLGGTGDNTFTATGGGNHYTGIAGAASTALIVTVSASATLAGTAASGTLTLGGGAAMETLTNVTSVAITDTSAGGKTLDGSGYAGTLTLVAAHGGDTMKGGTGNNQFTGTKGANSIVTQSALMNEIIESGDWDFTLTNTATTASLIAKTPGTSTVQLTDNVTGAGLTDATITGGNSNETLDASGFTGNTKLVGGSGTDVILSSQGTASQQASNIIVSGGGGGSIVGGANATNTPGFFRASRPM